MKKRKLAETKYTWEVLRTQRRTQKEMKRLAPKSDSMLPLSLLRHLFCGRDQVLMLCSTQVQEGLRPFARRIGLRYVRAPQVWLLRVVVGGYEEEEGGEGGGYDDHGGDIISGPSQGSIRRCCRRSGGSFCSTCYRGDHTYHARSSDPSKTKTTTLAGASITSSAGVPASIPRCQPSNKPPDSNRNPKTVSLPALPQIHAFYFLSSSSRTTASARRCATNASLLQEARNTSTLRRTRPPSN